MNPAILMAALQALQGGGQNIPPGQVMPSPPTQQESPVTVTGQRAPMQLPMTRPMGPSIAPGANPPPPGEMPAPGTQPPQQIGSPNPMAQQLLGQSIAGMNQPIPGYNQQQPSGLHGLAAILQAITGGLGQGLAGYGYGRMTGPQQVEQQQLEQQKAETMGRLAQALQQQQIMAEYYGARTGTAEERAKTAEEVAQTGAKKADITAADVGSKIETRAKTLDLGQAKLELDKQLADSQIAFRSGTLAQRTEALQQNAEKIAQTYEIAKGKLALGEVRNELGAQANGIRQQLANTLELARQQAGTKDATDASLAVAKMRNESWFKDLIGEAVPGLFGGLGQAESTIQQALPFPGSTSPTPSVLGTPPTTGTPAQPAKPTPQAKAGAKAGKPAAGGVTKVVRGPDGRLTIVGAQ